MFPNTSSFTNVVIFIFCLYSHQNLESISCTHKVHYSGMYGGLKMGRVLFTNLPDETYKEEALFILHSTFRPEPKRILTWQAELAWAAGEHHPPPPLPHRTKFHQPTGLLFIALYCTIIPRYDCLVFPIAVTGTLQQSIFLTFIMRQFILCASTVDYSLWKNKKRRIFPQNTCTSSPALDMTEIN